MRWNCASLLFVGASLTALATQAPAQDVQTDDKAKAATTGKAKVPAPPATVVVPPAQGSATVSAPAGKTAPIAVPIAPVKIAPVIKLPLPAAIPPAPAATGTLTLPIHTTTAVLSAVGRGHDVPTVAFTPVRILTSAVGAVGRGPAPAAAPFEPVRVRTAPLGAAGRPAGS